MQKPGVQLNTVSRKCNGCMAVLLEDGIMKAGEKVYCTYKYRLYPNKAQEELIQKTFGCCRWVFNHFLAERIETYKNTGKSPTRFDQQKTLTSLKKELEWLKEVDSTALRSPIEDLDLAYKNFFRRVKLGDKPGFPKFKSKKEHRKAYRSISSAIRVEGSKIKLPKLGLVKCKISRQIQGTIAYVTVSQNPSGKYFVSVCCKDVEIQSLPKTGKEVGLDMGIRSLVITSDGVTYPNHKYLAKSQKKLANLQRQLSRKSKGSKRREKARIKVARLYEHIRNQRQDSLHRLSIGLVREYDVICLQDLDVQGLIKKSKFAKEISDAVWAELRRQLEYKAEWYGKKVITVDRFFPSSQTCHVCGAKNPKVKDLFIRKWVCPECGASHDKDINAAKNILEEGLKQVS